MVQETDAAKANSAQHEHGQKSLARVHSWPSSKSNISPISLSPSRAGPTLASWRTSRDGGRLAISTQVAYWMGKRKRSLPILRERDIGPTRKYCSCTRCALSESAKLSTLVIPLSSSRPTYVSLPACAFGLAEADINWKLAALGKRSVRSYSSSSQTT